MLFLTRKNKTHKEDQLKGGRRALKQSAAFLSHATTVVKDDNRSHHYDVLPSFKLSFLSYNGQGQTDNASPGD